eukprot:11325683-Ditylum_brightwellii.AAC.1
MQLYANAGTVPTILGGGNRGHMRLVMDATIYHAVAGVTYNQPLKPTRQMLRTNATSAERESAEKYTKIS